jgi:hypothetical protein
MEIEKKRETSWKIELKNTDQFIELTSVEISGVVRKIKLALYNKDKFIRVNLSREEFFKFLSLISAFKDVVIGEDSIVSIKETYMNLQQTSHSDQYSPVKKDTFSGNHKNKEEVLENNDSEELNPKEWDPW